jgi:hypothetical protein
VRKCILHLGMNKCGSSTIQHCFSRYDDGATRYLSFPWPNHSTIVRAGFMVKTYARDLAVLGVADHAAARQAARDVIAKDAEANSKNLIISSEYMSTFQLLEVEHLVEFLKQWFDEVHAIAYVRDPRSFMPSSFQQGLKQGPAKFELNRYFPRYKNRLSVWLDVLGPGNVQYVSLDPTVLHDGNLVADFAKRFGLVNPEESAQTRKNTSYSAEAMSVLFLYRNLRGNVSDSSSITPQQNKELLLRLLSLGRKSFGFDPSVLDPILEANHDQIAWMEGRLVGQLMPQSRRTPDVLFASAEQIEAYAKECLPLVKDWYRATFPSANTVPDDVIGIIDAAYRQIGEKVSFKIKNKGRSLLELAMRRIKPGSA